MTTINYIASEIDISVLNDNFYQSTKPSTCNISEFKLFFSEGYTINFIYNDKNGKFISKYNVTPADCIK